MGTSSSTVPCYSHDDVERLLDLDECIAAVRDAMGLTEDGFEQPLRSGVRLAPGQGFALMPGVGHGELGFGAKIISVFADPARPGRSAHRGVVVVFDRASGHVCCLADAGAITAIRTGCASAVATAALAREDARVLAIFGTGVQARSHASRSASAQVDLLVLWGRDRDRTEAATDLAATLELDIKSCATGRWPQQSRKSSARSPAPAHRSSAATGAPGHT
jgi:ornithine cyclodeaminase